VAEEQAEDRVAMALGLSDICLLFANKGARAYDGDRVTQLEHALQTAARAEADCAPPALIAAALLHDLGHLLTDQGETPALRGIDDRHQCAALPFLGDLYGEAVLEAIRLHVDAKRYLCATDAGYYDALSPHSKRSLILQGGVYDAAQAAAFIGQPHADDAVRVRRWDDLAKIEGAPTPPLAHFIAALEAAQRA
jgi:phosphonate degradation associated HDIG domain protein